MGIKWLVGSQKIGHLGPVVLAVGALWHSLEDDEVPLQVLVQAQQAGLVIHPVTVVRRRPHCHQFLIKPVVVTLLHQLVSPHDQFHSIQSVELFDHLVAEDPAGASGVPPPSIDVVGVGPHEVRERALVGDLLLPVEQAHLVDGGEVGGHASVDAQDAAVDDCAEGQEVEGLVEIFPAVGVAVLAVDFVQEAVHHGDVPALVVAPQQENAVWILHLQAEEQSDGLDRVVASVHKVPDHDELVVWDPTALPEQFLDVKELAVHIAGDFDGGVDNDDIGLVNEDVLDHVAEGADAGFSDGLAGPGIFKPLVQFGHAQQIILFKWAGSANYCSNPTMIKNAYPPLTPAGSPALTASPSAIFSAAPSPARCRFPPPPSTPAPARSSAPRRRKTPKQSHCRTSTRSFISVSQRSAPCRRSGYPPPLLSTRP